MSMATNTASEQPNSDPPWRYIITAVVVSYAVAGVVGWGSGVVLKTLGYTHRLDVQLVGGGASDTIHPIAGEWYGGLFGVLALLGMVVYTLHIRPQRWET